MRRDDQLADRCVALGARWDRSIVRNRHFGGGSFARARAADRPTSPTVTPPWAVGLLGAHVPAASIDQRAGYRTGRSANICAAGRVVKEVAAGERRVALTPDVLGKLEDAGLEILVETGGRRCAVHRREPRTG